MGGWPLLVEAAISLRKSLCYNDFSTRYGLRVSPGVSEGRKSRYPLGLREKHAETERSGGSAASPPRCVAVHWRFWTRHGSSWREPARSCFPIGSASSSRRSNCAGCSGSTGSRPCHTAFAQASGTGRPRRRIIRARSSRHGPRGGPESGSKQLEEKQLRKHGIEQVRAHDRLASTLNSARSSRRPSRMWSRTGSKPPIGARTCSSADAASWTTGRPTWPARVENRRPCPIRCAAARSTSAQRERTALNVDDMIAGLVPTGGARVKDPPDSCMEG